MGKVHIGRNDKPQRALIVNAPDSISEIKLQETEVIYIDRPIEVIKEVRVEIPIDRIITIEKPIEVIVEKIIEVPRLIIEYKNVEVPVLYEKEVIKEVPVYIEKEVTPKVIDIMGYLEMKRQIRKNKFLRNALIIAMILNLILLVK